AILPWSAGSTLAMPVMCRSFRLRARVGASSLFALFLPTPSSLYLKTHVAFLPQHVQLLRGITRSIEFPLPGSSQKCPVNFNAKFTLKRWALQRHDEERVKWPVFLPKDAVPEHLDMNDCLVLSPLDPRESHGLA